MTDAHGSKTKDLSVSIRVNPWLKLDFSASYNTAPGIDTPDESD